LTDTISTKAVTPIATLSYPHLDKPQDGKKASDKKKYPATLVFAPGADLSALKAAANAAGEKKFPGRFSEMVRLGQIRSPFRLDAEAKGYADGSVFQNVRTEQQPGIVYSHAGVDGKPAKMAQENILAEMYPGAQVRASVTFFGYDVDGNKGVSAALNNLQKVGEGTRLDSRSAAEDEFTADLSAAPVDISGLI
jgi:hypothetical protein